MMGEGIYADRWKYPFPTLLIDLNMEDGDGFDVLEFVQANPGWQVLPRVVFSSSDDDDDIRTAYLLGASSYHCKPSTSTALDRRLRDIVEYGASAEIPPVDVNGRHLATNSLGRRGARYPQPLRGR